MTLNIAHYRIFFKILSNDPICNGSKTQTQKHNCISIINILQQKRTKTQLE